MSTHATIAIELFGGLVIQQYNYIMRKNSRYDWYYTIGSEKNLNLLKFPDDVV